jgi:hypothetical protein
MLPIYYEPNTETAAEAEGGEEELKQRITRRSLLAMIILDFNRVSDSRPLRLAMGRPQN